MGDRWLFTVLGDLCLSEGWEAKYWEMDGYVLEINVEIREMSD